MKKLVRKRRMLRRNKQRKLRLLKTMKLIKRFNKTSRDNLRVILMENMVGENWKSKRK